MDLEEFRQEIQKDISMECMISNGNGDTAVFAETITKMMQTAEYLPNDFQEGFYKGVSKKRRRNMRVDGYIHDLADNSMIVFIVHYADTAGSMTKTLAEANFKMLSTFIEDAVGTDLYMDIEPSRSVAGLIDTLRDERENIQKYTFILLTNAKRSSKLQKLDSFEVDGKLAECQVWDIERIFEIYNSMQNREPIEIDFEKYLSHGIPCIEAKGVATETYKSYLCIIPGAALADIYDEYGSRLLEGNVRSFLSSKMAVNKKIRATILNEPAMFFAYNNGIAATAKDLKFKHTSSGKMLLEAVDFQIINGGQTTASLSNTRFKDKADLVNVYVQMKITEIGEMENEEAENLIKNISRSSNSQNKVSEADFFAMHPFHIEMETISRRILAPATEGMQYQTKWFYERARGQYIQSQMRMTPSQKKLFETQNPKKQVITKTDLAKYRFSWDGHPDIVSKGAQSNFMKFAESVSESWDHDKTQFNERYFKETVALAVLFNSLEELVSKQTWYNSYRANIVTYTIALFHHVLKEKFKNMEFDLIQIWNVQKIPDGLIELFKKMTHDVNDFIIREDRPIVNVTQWCKNSLCWQRMRENIEVNLPDNIFSILRDKKTIKTEEKEAKKDQEFVSEMESLKKVIAIDGHIWRQVSTDAKQLHLIADEKEAAALKIAERIPTKIPQDFQAKLLLRVLDRMKENGHIYF